MAYRFNTVPNVILDHEPEWIATMAEVVRVRDEEAERMSKRRG